MYVAATNFKAGKEHQYKKGQVVKAEGELLKKFQADGLVTKQSSEEKSEAKVEEPKAEHQDEKPSKKSKK